jgi:serine/threonine protein kinase
VSEARRNPVDELAEEFVERYRRGERPAISEYTQRHPELAEEIHEVFPALVMIEEAGPEEPGPIHARAASITADGRPLEQLGDYHILRQIGRGGMGVVYEAVQEALGRHVALKVLPFTLSSDPTHLKRFRREARSAARLHHTNIVPVFDIGECRGIHYYAMQFIQGQGLDEILQELRRLRCFHPTTNGVETGREGDEERGRQSVLGSEMEICDRDQSFSLATGLLTGQFRTDDSPEEKQEIRSQRSEIRGQRSEVGKQKPEPGALATGAPDVRPDSDSTLSLIGGSSEFSAQSEYHFYRSVARVGLQVAEALAYAHGQKVLHRDIKPSNLLLDLQGTIWVTDFGLAKEEESDDLTRTGDIVGTLRYMAPERFSGQADRRSDIYSLGMTLFELLTLRPAFPEMDRARLIQRITREEPPRPRKIDARIPRDLETIICKAIAKEPADRYVTAEALGEDLRRFLADRPIRARRASFMEKSLRWCRRNPALAWLAATLLLALLSGTAGIAWQWRRAEVNYRAARAQRARADANARKARAALDEAFTRVSESKLIQVPGAQPLRRELLQAALGYYRDFLDEARDDPELQADVAAAYFRVASANIMLNQADEAVAALRDGLDLVEKLLAEHPEDRELPMRLAGFLRSARVLHDDSWLLSKTRRDEDTFRRASKLWERFAHDYPAVEGFRSDLALFALLQVEEPRDGQDGEIALSFCRQARELMETLVCEHPTELVYHELLRRAYYSAESLLNALGRHAEAEVLVRDAVAFFERQEAEHPSLPHPRFDQAVLLNILGHLLGETGRPTEAQAVHQRAVGILEELYKNSPDEVAEELAESHHDLGGVYHFLGRSAEAERAFRRAAAIWEKLATALPGDPNFQANWAKNGYLLGELLAFQNRMEEADKVFGQGAQLEEKLAEQYPALEKYALDAWRFRRQQACLLIAVGREHEADRIVRESYDGLEKLKTENATKPEYWRSLADNQRFRAHLLVLGKRPEEAAEALEHCVALVQERPTLFREELFSRGPLEGSTWFLLELLNRSRRYPQAEIVRRQVIDLYDRLAGLNADNPDFLVHETRHLLSLTGWLRGQSRPKAAEQVLPRALDCYRCYRPTSFPRGIVRELMSAAEAMAAIKG